MLTPITNRMPRPPRPPVRALLSLLPLLLLMLLPAAFYAQFNCFSGFNAGDNTSYCEGETATLDGGYDFYDEIGDPDVGTPTLTWVATTGSGTFAFDGTTGATASNSNFNNSENGITGFPDVTFTPDPGVTLVVLQLQGGASAGPCSAVLEVEEVTLYFDPVQDTPIDAFVEGTPVLDDALGAGNTITTATGESLSLIIDESNVIDNGQQNDDIRRYEVTYAGAGGFMGLPASGDSYTQTEFETAFSDLVLTSISCDPATITMNIRAYYDRDNDMELSGAEECPGPVTEVAITVNPRPVPQTTIGVANPESAVCEDDENVLIVVTGTLFTTVTYNVSYDGGATNTIEGATLELDGTGVSLDIVVDATLADSDDDIIVTLTQIEYTNGPACPVTISKPVVIDVFPLPTLMLELVNPGDSLLCNQANGGPSSIQYRVLTSSGDGVYSFTVIDIVDGVEIQDVTFNNETFTNGVGPTLNFAMNGVFQSSQLITLMVDGASVTREDLLIACTNNSPDASITWVVQPDLFATVNVEVNDDGELVLNDDSDDNLLEVSVCDEGNLSIDLDDLPAGFVAAASTSAQVEVTVDNPDNVPGVPSGGIFDFDTNAFSFDGPLNIPNSQAASSEITFTFTPYFEDNGSIGFDGDECNGTPLTLIVEVRPAPTVTVAITDTLVCSGDDVTVIITASEPGVASLILDQGGDPILVDVNVPDGDNFTGEYDSDELDALTMFTVTTFNGDVAGCPATVNQMVMANVEELPDADISVDPSSICNGDDATFTLAGLAGSGDGFSFTYSVNGGTPVVEDTDPGETTVDIVLTNNTAAGTISIELLSVRNLTDLECEVEINETATLSIEDLPVVTCDADDDLCSGDAYSLSFTAGSPDPSAIGSDLYYQIVVTDNTSGTPVVTTTYELAADDPTVDGTAVNMTGFDQTITVEAIPFYFDGVAPDGDDFADACQGESCETVLTVSTMPMATFGGNDAICDGESGTLIFTGPPNGSVRLKEVDEDGNVLIDFGIYEFDGGGTTVLFANDFSLDFIIQLCEVTDEDGCTGEMTFEFAVDVTPRPTASFDPDLDATICEGTDRTITLTGTPNATVTISTTDAIGTISIEVVLDDDGNGSFDVTGDADQTFTITAVTVGAEDNNGDGFTCSATEEEIDELEPFELTVNPAPVGALVSNAVLCTGDSPEIQFNLTTEDDDLSGSFDIVVNGIEFFDIINGEVLDFSGTAFATLTETTDFVLTFIQESDEPLACIDNIDGDIFIRTVVVNAIPEVAISGVPAGPVCSGDEVLLTSAGMPAASADGNVLFYELILDNGVGEPAGTAVTTLVSAADVDAGGLNGALGLPDAFVNGSTTINDEIAFRIRPYYETSPDAPFGTESCGEVMSGFSTNGFAAGDWDVSRTTTGGGAASVDFTATEMTLSLIDTDNDGLFGNGGADNNFDAADARYSVPGTGELSFDFEYDINDGVFIPFVGFFPADVFLVGFEGNVVFRNPANSFNGAGTIEVVTTPGDELVVRLRDVLVPGLTEQVNTSTVSITNLEFTPACQPCPGEEVAVSFEVLPQLFADFSSVPGRVCEGDNAEICITGTPDATVTVFLGNGIFNDVKLDGDGNGCITTLGGLFVDSEFIILGLTTLDDMPQCSFSYEGDGPVAPVAVTPTPSATISLDPTTVCAGDVISAEVNGTENATVSYTLDGVAGSVDLNGDGEGEILLPTVNDGLSDLSYDVVLTGISVTIEDVTCTNDLDDTVTLTVRPLPTGTISAGPAVCDGEQGELFFTAASDLLEGYSITVLDPNGVELELNGASGGSFLSTNVAGTYTLLSITDGTGTAIGCTNTGDFGTAEIIIEEEPNLTAAITGTVGTANLDSESNIYNIFRGLVCDEGTINVAFGSSTEDAQALGELMIEVQVVLNDDDQVNVGALGTRVITFDELNDADFLDGILDNVDDERVTSIEVVLTPFFENGADAGAVEVEDCTGGTLSFFIDIVPAVALEIDANSSTLVVCEGDDIVISLTGTPGAEVTFSSTGIDLDEGSDDNVVELDDNGEATINGTAQGAGTASVSIDMVMVTSLNNAGNISRQCMLMDADEVEIIINEVPSAELSIDPEGPICNGDNVDVIITLGEGEEDGDYTVIINGVSYDVTTVGGLATVFNSGALTSSTSFELTSITNGETTCSNAGTPLSFAAVLVEQIPAGEVIVTIDGEKTTVSDGVAAEFQICANERVDLYARNTNEGAMGSFTSSLDSGDPVFNRPSLNSTSTDCEAADGTNDIGNAGLNVYYETYDFTIDVAGTYTFMMGNSPDVDDFLALYEGGFDPNDVCANFLAQDDDGGEGLESEIMIMLTLAPGNYTLVATSFDDFEEGNYVISYGGNDGGTITGLPNTGPGMETFSASLDASDGVFSRPTPSSTPGSCSTEGNKYYDAYNFTIDVADTYTFMMGNSPDVDDFLVLYEGGFDPNDACANLLEQDDDGGPGFESEIMIVLTLVPGNYTLVTTSFGDLDEGDYEVKYGSANGGTICGLPTGDDPLVGDDYVSVDFSISEDIDFFGLGQSGTIALPIEDFGEQFSRTYNMIFGSPVTVELAVTYYNENGEVIGLSGGECVGATDLITIVINPNPKTEDVATMTCSGVALDYDLDAAITNGVTGATFSYTVASDDIDVSGLDRTIASAANVTDMFTNFSAGDYTVTYTVTPFGTDGEEDCQGNDFELVVTIKPQPGITAEQEAEVCSGEETLCIIEIDNDIIGAESFELIEVVLSDTSINFLAAPGNANVGDAGNLMLIAGDVFINVGSAPATVTYTLRPTSAAGCVGADEVIVVTVLPEPVVGDMTMKVCSGSTLNLGFDELTANGVGNVLSFTRNILPLTTLRVFDENGVDVTLQSSFGAGSESNDDLDAIGDSFLNQGTASLFVNYEVTIQVTDGTEEGLACEPVTFSLIVEVVEEADVVLEPLGGQSAICAGEPITLVATYDGSGTITNVDYNSTSDDGVVLALSPSAAGLEVEVDVVSGIGVATVMVMITDDNGCVAMATRPVSVGTTPDVMDIAGFEDPCTGDPNFYSIAGTDGSTYEWTLSNPAAGAFTNGTQTGDDVSITFNNSQGAGPFELSVTETTAAGCSATSTLEVTVVTGTTAAFSAMQDENDGLTFNFTELAAGGVEAYIWDFGDGIGTSNEQNPSYTYAPADSDAMETYTVTLTVLGCSGPVSATMDVVVNSTLETDVIELREGINFISLDVAPDDNRLDAIFSGVSGLRRITTVNDGSASFYQPGAGPFNSLQTAEPGFGYVVIMNNDATLTVTGEPIDDDFIRPMGMGINYMAFVPDGQMVAANFWSDFEATDEFVLARTFGNNVTPNVQSYFPGFGPFNSMQYTFNGVGYLVLQRDDADALEVADLERSSEDYEFLYGTVAGTDYRSGDPIEILDEDGRVVGQLTPDASGLFQATPLYGKVAGEDGITTGAIDPGARLSFRYQGQVIDAGVSFQGQFNGTELNLDFSNAPTTDELTLKVMPNPAFERTSIVLQLTSSTNLSVEAVDATGRIVRTLLPRQQLAAGTTTIEWDDLGQLPAGMYHILVTRDGRIDTDLTQRLIKR